MNCFFASLCFSLPSLFAVARSAHPLNALRGNPVIWLLPILVGYYHRSAGEEHQGEESTPSKEIFPTADLFILVKLLKMSAS